MYHMFLAQNGFWGLNHKPMFSFPLQVLVEENRRVENVRIKYRKMYRLAEPFHCSQTPLLGKGSFLRYICLGDWALLFHFKAGPSFIYSSVYLSSLPVKQCLLVKGERLFDI